MKGWMARPNSPIDDVFFSIETLRGRSRDLYESNTIAAGVIDTTVLYVIGTGLQPLPDVDAEVLGITEDEADKLNDQIRKEFYIWASSPNCDFYRRQNFFQIQEMALRTMLLSGDCPVIMTYLDRPGVEYKLVLRHLESDRVCNPLYYNWERPIYSGIETDEKGEVIAYHVKQVHPYQGVINATILKNLYSWVRIEAYGEKTGRPNVLLLAEFKRPEQPRGVPILAHVLEVLKDSDRFMKAAISAEEVAAKFVIAITSQFPNQDFLDTLSKEEKELLYSLKDYEVPIEGQNKAIFLKPGDTLAMLNNTRANSNFEALVTATAKFIGAGVGMPYDILLATFSGNFSASRGSVLRWGKRVNYLRNLCGSQFLNPVYSEWMSEAVATDRLSLPGYFEDGRKRLAYERCEWSGTGMGALAPGEEVTAARDRISTLITNVEEETLAYDGSSFRRNMKKLKKELEICKEVGVSHPAVAEPAKVHQTFTDDLKNEDAASVPDNEKKAAESEERKTSNLSVRRTLNYSEESAPGETLIFGKP
jgi:lambda family phage portal protein